ncbi:hypothetical protein [Azospirillum sp. TSA2s]|uniref:hypothetical protein n=1 Tax=Azospirillum sp. TSA2s TaxID=709810 RepID=UPI001FFF103B|nr:hypothetical protein [Azospirillum sp. TSA2s]
MGRATALAFAREGARPASAARREELLEGVAEECRGLSTSVKRLNASAMPKNKEGPPFPAALPLSIRVSSTPRRSP